MWVGAHCAQDVQAIGRNGNRPPLPLLHGPSDTEIIIIMLLPSGYSRSRYRTPTRRAEGPRIALHCLQRLVFPHVKATISATRVAMSLSMSGGDSFPDPTNSPTHHTCIPCIDFREATTTADTDTHVLSRFTLERGLHPQLRSTGLSLSAARISPRFLATPLTIW